MDAVAGNDLLKRLTEETRNGYVECINSAEKLPEFFLRSFGAIANRQFDPFDDHYEITSAQSALLSGATFIHVSDTPNCDLHAVAVQQPCAKISDTSGAQFSADMLRTDLNVYSDAHFLILTLPQPFIPGKWDLEGHWFAVLQTDLRMDVDASQRQPAGQLYAHAFLRQPLLCSHARSVRG